MKKTTKIIALTLCFVMICLYLTIGAAAADSYTWESEPNNGRAEADTLSINGEIGGVSDNSSDKDCFVITPNKNGRIDLEFKTEYSKTNATWYVDIGVENNGTYTVTSSVYVNSQSDDKAGTMVKKFATVGVEVGAKYFVTVRAYNGNITLGSAYYCVGKTYYITSKFTESLINSGDADSDWESEPNDIRAEADKLSVNGKIGGVSGHSDDVDCFVIEPTKAGKIDIGINTEYSKKYVTWYVDIGVIESDSYSQISSYFVNAKSEDFSGTMKKQLTTIDVKPGAKYFVTVRAYNDNITPGSTTYCVGQNYYITTSSNIGSSINIGGDNIDDTIPDTGSDTSGAGGLFSFIIELLMSIIAGILRLFVVA